MLRTCILLVCGTFLASPWQAAAGPLPTQKPSGQVVLAQKLVTSLAEGDFSQVVDQFDAELRKTLSAERLGQAWQFLLGRVGAFKKSWAVQKYQRQEYDILRVSCEFERDSVDAEFVFDAKQRIRACGLSPAVSRHRHRWHTRRRPM